MRRMEDGGTVGQWSDNKRQSRKSVDAKRNSSMANVTGSSVLLSWSNGRSADRKRTLSQENSGSLSTFGGLPPIESSQRGHSRTAVGSSKSTAASKKGRKATGSPSSSLSISGSKKADSRVSSSRGKTSKKGAQQRRKSTSPTATRSRGSSRASSAGSSRRKSPKAKGRGRIGSLKGRRKSPRGRKDSKGKKGVRRSDALGSRSKGDALLAALAAVEVAETEQRTALVKKEEVAREAFLPDYHLLVMNLVSSQMVQVNQQQQELNDAFKALQAHGIQVSSGQDIHTAVELLRAQMQADFQKQADEVRVENAALRNLLEEKKTELEQKVANEQTLRDKVNRRLVRFEVETESLKAEVQSVLQTSFLDVERMKRELGHRLDVATASLRTPKYDTALRSMQDLASAVQEEIQNHHDTMVKLIVSLEAQDTFLRDKSDSMHSRFPTRYRDELQKMEKDQLLNLLDILSFHDVVVETTGKALYILKKGEHTTNVF